VSGERPDRCAECGSALARDQRYCLTCGARVGPRSPQLAALLARIGAPGRPHGPSGAAATAPGAAAGVSAPPRAPGLRLPAPQISAVLVVLFAVFGVLLGVLSGSPVNDTLAASARGPLRLVLPATAASGSAGSPPSSSRAPASEAPEGRPAPTPAPAAPGSATTTAAAPSAGAKGGETVAGGSGETAGGGGAAKLPAIKHVFVIMLADQPYAGVFGPSSPAHYLAGTLERHGALLVRYDAIAHEELANEIALVSGQGPTPQTAANCPAYTDIAPATVAARQQVLGSGCVYPAATNTLPGQLAARHLSWRAYVQGMDEGAGGPSACGHPSLGQPDPSSTVPGSSAVAPAGPYATFRNPFAYFHSLIDSPACAADDVGLNRLKADLGAPAHTPSLSYIVPDRCHDGSPSPCAAGATPGMVPADAMLRQLVPEIIGSRAYKDGGLLVITVDEAPSSGEFADSSSCCGQPPFPNLAAPDPTAPIGRGGGTVGALLLSPFIKGAATSQQPYSHFSLLRTIEDVFGLGHLGYAGLGAVKPFEASLFTRRRVPGR
jgi:phosphatidylinositol-3-phosphatase